MRVAAYCRVSTDKNDQLNSLEAQKRFFTEYAEKNGHRLVRLYADEGVSGTKLRRRRAFLQLMDDARAGLFEMVVVKDISRFARNTVDLLNSTRELKALHIETLFLTANMGVLGNSEFVLTIFGALAQEESANTSKRIKFGKRLNAAKGRVPNLVYGYDKVPGDCFGLRVNPREADVVRRVYDWYVQEGISAAKIAGRLNEEGVRTKRDCRWSQNAVCRILTNALYTGRVVNGRQEVADFLTGARIDRPPSDWYVTERPELRIVEPVLQARARQLLESRATRKSGPRSGRQLFSALLYCGVCGHGFRRVSGSRRPRWVCGRRNADGVDACPNAVTVEEAALRQTLRDHFARFLPEPDVFLRQLAGELRKGADGSSEAEPLQKRLTALAQRRQRYIGLCADGLLTQDELRQRLEACRQETEQLEARLKQLTAPAREDESLAMLRREFPAPEAVYDPELLGGSRLRLLIDRIEVSGDGALDIYVHDLQKSG